MNRQIKGLLFFYIKDNRHSFNIFWTILLLIAIFSLAFTYLFVNGENDRMALSITGPIYVFCSIIGFRMVSDAIPFSIKMGATRKNIFISIGLFFVGLSLLMSVMATILQELIKLFNQLVSIDTFMFIHPAYFVEDNWYTRIILDASIVFFSMAFLFLIGLVFYRFGLLGGGSLVGVLIITLFIGLAQGWLADFAVNVFKSIDLTSFYVLFGIGLVIFAMTFVLVKNITTIKVT